MTAPSSLLRLLVVTAALAALAGCGRRGSLEPPGTAATAPRGAATVASKPVPTAAQGAGTAAALDDEDEDTVSVAPVPAPSNRRRKGYTVPQGPFILDPIL